MGTAPPSGPPIKPPQPGAPGRRTPADEEAPTQPEASTSVWDRIPTDPLAFEPSPDDL